MIAGNGAYLEAGDGGLATSAALCFPWDSTVDTAGNLFFADQCSSRVYKVTPSGVISTVAGSGQGMAAFGYSGDGSPATSAALGGPSGSR